MIGMVVNILQDLRIHFDNLSTFQAFLYVVVFLVVAMCLVGVASKGKSKGKTQVASDRGLAGHNIIQVVLKLRKANKLKREGYSENDIAGILGIAPFLLSEWRRKYRNLSLEDAQKEYKKIKNKK